MTRSFPRARPDDRLAAERADRIRLDRPLLNANEAGALLGGIPRFTVLQMARDGRIPCLRVGKHVRFAPAELEAWLTEHRSV